MTSRPADPDPAPADVLERLLVDLADVTVDDEVTTMPSPGATDDDREATFLAYAGLVDVLAEAVLHSVPPERREQLIGGALRSAGAAEGPLRFARYERGWTAEQQELVSRMRGKDIAVTSEWLLPRLEADIDAYRRRIEALRSAIEEGEG
jgi:hypothetical protein